MISPAILLITTAGTSEVLVQEGSEALPIVYVLLAAVSIPLASGISTALARWSASQVCRAACQTALLVCLALRGALALRLPGAPQGICIAAYVIEIVFDTLFWLIVSDHLTTLELKRHMPFLAMSFGVGGIIAGFVAAGFCALLPADDLLVLDSIVFALCLMQFLRIQRRFTPLAAGDDAEQEAGIIEAVRATYVVFRAFPLTVAIAGGIFLMSALFCLQDYLTLTIYAEDIPDKESLASFMARAYAGQQAAEFLVLALLGRAVLERAGPLLRNVFFPLTTLASLLALQVIWCLPFAILVHVNANALSNAIFEPVKNLNYAALPFRMLAPVRMLVEGVVYPAGIALSGFALMWMQSAFAPPTVLAVAIVLSALFVSASAIVGFGFLPSLLRSLRLRAVTPSEYTSEPGRRFCRADIRSLLLHSDADARSFGRDLARRLAPDLLAVGGCPERRPGSRLVPAVSQRLYRRSFAWLGGSVRSLSHKLGTPGEELLRPGWRLQGASTPCALHHQSRAVARCELAELGRALEHENSSERRAAALHLARHGNRAVPVIAKRLSSNRSEVVVAAINALGHIRTRRAHRILRDFLRPLYRQARLNLAGLAALEKTAHGQLPESARLHLADALVDSNERIVRRILAVKSALGDCRDINFLHSLVQQPEPRVRSDALEALASLPTGRLIRPVIALLDAVQSSTAEHAPMLRLRSGKVGDAATAIWRAAANDPWIRLFAGRLLGSDDERTRGGDGTMIDVVLFLKSVPLFRAGSFEEIARIAEKTQSVSLREGERLIVEGETITHVHVIRNGSIELTKNDSVVEIINAGSCIGEHAIFGHHHYEVSGRALTDLLLLRFPVSIAADLVAEHPQLLRPVLGDLVQRLNMLHTLLAETRAVSCRETSDQPDRQTSRGRAVLPERRRQLAPSQLTSRAA
jgi:CRP-like cAMP-binding protein